MSERDVKESLWRKSAVRINCDKGPEEVPALVHENAPGIAVTMHHFGLFDVTHVGSGMKIAGHYERAGSAALVMVQLAAICDYTGDQESVVRQIKEKVDDPVPFDGATSTGKDGTRPLTVGEWLSMERDPWGFEFPWESADDDPWTKANKLLAARGALDESEAE